MGQEFILLMSGIRGFDAPLDVRLLVSCASGKVFRQGWLVSESALLLTTEPSRRKPWLWISPRKHELAVPT